MSTISVSLVERSVQNPFPKGSHLVVMVITTIFKGYKRFSGAATEQCSLKKGVLKIFAKFTVKEHLCLSLFLIKLQA